MPVTQSQGSSENSQSDGLTKLIKVARESVHAKHRKRVKAALQSAHRDVAGVTEKHAMAIKRHKMELTDLTETCKTNLDKIDATLSELWQNLEGAKQTMQTSQLKFQQGVSELLRRYGQSREVGVKMINEYLSAEMSAPEVQHFLAILHPPPSNPGQPVQKIKTGRISGATLVNRTPGADSMEIY